MIYQVKESKLSVRFNIVPSKVWCIEH